MVIGGLRPITPFDQIRIAAIEPTAQSGETVADFLAVDEPFEVCGSSGHVGTSSQRFFHWGRRFSAKASGPSWASSLRYTRSDTWRAACSAAVRPISVESITISRAA